MQQRYYDPWAGRFLSVDPVTPRIGGGFNRYQYANNNPYRYIDPNGLDSRDDQIAKEQARTQDRVCGGGAYCSSGSTQPQPTAALSAALPAGAPGSAVEHTSDLVGGSLLYGADKLDDFQKSEVGHLLQGLPPEAAAIGGVKGGMVWLGRLGKAGAVFKTTQEAAAAAERLGFVRVAETIQGQAVFRSGRTFITRDIDGHNGGAWKVANSARALAAKETRTGTFSSDLKIRIGD